MFKFLTDKDRLRKSHQEIARLKALVGELPQTEVIEDVGMQEEVKSNTLSDKVVSIEEEINIIFGSGE